MRRPGTILLVALIALIGVPLAGEENASKVPASNAVSGPIGSTSWTGGMSYTYDGAGNVTKVGNDVFVYDRVDRLVSDTVSGIERRHAFDAFGNRTSCADMASGGDCQGATIVTGTNRISGATYDAAGNLTAYGGNTYTYDVTGMMIRDTAVAGGREYVYTASGERIAVIESATSTWNWTLRDSSAKVLREMTSTATANGSHTNWTWTKDNIWRDSQLLSSVQRSGATTTTFHYHLDHLGTPRVVSNTSGTIVGAHDYAAFGTELSGNLKESPESRLKFTGHERDTVGGSTEPLDYMHARFYNARWGRFLSVDPGRDWNVRQPQSWNMYTYSRNNPIAYVDPDGASARSAIAYLIRSASTGLWRQVTRKKAVQTAASGAVHRVKVRGGDGVVHEASSIVKDAFPGEKVLHHPPHRADGEWHFQPATWGLNGQVGYEIVKTVVGFVPVIGWAVDADATGVGESPVVEGRAQELFGKSYFLLTPEERRQVIESFGNPPEPPKPQEDEPEDPKEPKNPEDEELNPPL